ncbi:hypothetical protein Z945_808 [Sulfitobacter noctilucae]|uniref:hypothetical protein n=1 Tax=Sulfitobacter noctilucae TaxID=1342302 RepID=UPI000469F226|nr:hypothetical protein [Sulfitobacter noctilucae]KIN65761.1 hypothetical protein Z945_808 [Sulfitobacter noctilucae]
MTSEKPLYFFLEEPLRESAAAGEHNFLNLVSEVVTNSGFSVQFEGLPATRTGNYSLGHMAQPPDDKGLVFRRVYHYPFWQIDAVAQRWQGDVARARFIPEQAPSDAPRFYRFWQKRLFGDAPQSTHRDGFIFVPLQGQLTRKRVFQTCTPLKMIEHCLEYGGGRRVIATLHPSEAYNPSDLAALNALADEHRSLTVETGKMEQNLQRCDFVVTQNSGVAFNGFFFGKPALLFSQIDFHHIAIQADLDALGDSFARVAAHAPAYDKYIWWFWQDQSINAGRDDAKAKIAARLRRFGWPIK